MEIEIRADSVRISGYVNAVGRDSRPIASPTGEKFVEMVEPGSFARSLEKRSNVELRINHNQVIAKTQDGTLKLHEDTIGLRAEAVITDPAAIAKARAGKFRGWSFGMYTNQNSATMETRTNDIPRRHLHTFDMYEVTLVDDEAIPCYAGTSVEYRSDSEIISEVRSSENEQVTITEITPPDLSEFEKRACEIALRPFEERAAELRYNPYHDPTSGRFTSADGGGMGVLFVGKGQKGKGAYVFEKDNNVFSEDNEQFKYAISGNVAKVSSANPANMSINDLMSERDNNDLKIKAVKDAMNTFVKERDVTTPTMSDGYYRARKTLSELQARNTDLTIEIGKRKTKEAQNNTKTDKKTFVNSFGEATSRVITSTSYQRALAREKKAVLRNMGY